MVWCKIFSQPCRSWKKRLDKQPNTKNRNGAKQETASSRFGFLTVFKNIIFALFLFYTLIYSFSAGFHINRAPELLKSAAMQFFIPDIYTESRARLSLLRSLYRGFPKGTPLSEVKKNMASLGFTITKNEATLETDNFICSLSYRIIWNQDSTEETLVKFNGGASIECGL